MIEQTYPGFDDFKSHFDLLLPAFRDRRYLKVDGKPIFGVYDPRDLPDTPEFVALWRRLAEDAGLPGVHFFGMSNTYDADVLAPFDMLMEFGPGDFINRARRDLGSVIRRRLRLRDFTATFARRLGPWFTRPLRFAYDEVVETLTKAVWRDARDVPCVTPNWDNTPRAGNRGAVFENCTPELFERHLRHAVDLVASQPAQRRIVFLKAWNEWAEGNYVEPDRESGHRYLDAIRNVIVG